MAKSELPSPDLLRQLLDYDPETGVLIWKTRPRSLFKNSYDADPWNSRYAETRADKAPTSHLNKYRRVLVFDHSYPAHRIAWAVYHGSWPKHHIDHINGVHQDNRIINLRDVTALENRRNSARHGRNKSGVSGVRRRTDRIKESWVARVYRGGKAVCLGTFGTFEEAVKVRKEAEIAYGYHPNHGR